MQGLQYQSLQELPRLLPGPGLALPGLQEKQVSLIVLPGMSREMRVSGVFLDTTVNMTSNIPVEAQNQVRKNRNPPITVMALQSLRETGKV